MISGTTLAFVILGCIGYGAFIGIMAFKYCRKPFILEERAEMRKELEKEIRAELQVEIETEKEQIQSLQEELNAYKRMEEEYLRKINEEKNQDFLGKIKKKKNDE